MNIKPTLFFFLLLSFGQNLLAQQDNYIIKSLTIEGGLSNNHVTSVLEDSKGFIWVATYDGLNRWNGYGFEIFKKDSNDPNSISGNFIYSLAEDRKGNIWIGTNNAGLVRYNLAEDRFYRYYTEPGSENSIPGNIIRCLKVDLNGNVWIGTNYGLAKYQSGTDDFKRYSFPTGMSNDLVLDTRRIIDSNSIEIIVQNSLGIFTLNTENDLVNKLSLKVKGFDDLKISHTSPIFFDSYENLWIASSKGLIKRDSAGSVEVFENQPNNPRSLSSNSISQIFEDSKKNLWIGTTNKGLNLYDRLQGEFVVFRESNILDNDISNDIITHITEDSHSNLWVATQEGGVNVLSKNQSPFMFFSHNHQDKFSLSSNKIGSIWEDKNGIVWIGTKEGGINKYSQSTNTFDRYHLNTPAHASSVLGIVCADSEKLFAAGWDMGLYSFDKRNGRFEDLMKGRGAGVKSLSTNVKGLLRDSKGNVWLATHEKKGITVYDAKSDQFYNADNVGDFDPILLGVEYAVSFMEDSKGRLWIVTYAGIYMYDHKVHNIKHVENNSETLSSNYCFDIMEDSKGNIWVGSAGGIDQIFVKDDGLVAKRWNDVEDLPINIKGLLEDDRGDFWLSSNQGLTKWSHQNSQIKHYRINKEIPNQEFYERSRLKSKAGELYFGGIHGLLKFHPDSLIDQENSPRVYVVDFQLFNKSQKVGMEDSPIKKSIIETNFIELSHDQSVMTFEFAGLDFRPFQRLEYAYKMEGFDEEWYFVGEKRFATYTNLPSGSYTFKVQLAEGSELKDSGVAIEILIHPPFWLTPWAYFAYFCFIIAVFYFFRKSILYRAQLRNELKLEKIQIKNVTETNLMKLRFFTNVSHEFRTPLTLIKAPIEKLKSENTLGDEEKQYHFDLIQRNTDKLLKLVDQLMDYRKMEAGSLVLETSQGDIVAFANKVWAIFEVLAAKKHITYTFESKVQKIHMTFDADKLDKIISNLLSNAFKNTKEHGHITLIVDLLEVENESEKLVSISVKDNGVGIPKKDLKRIFERFYSAQQNEEDASSGTGIGLALSQELAELHNGKITVTSKKGEGSVFSLLIPLNVQSVSQKPTNKVDVIQEYKQEHDANVHNLKKTSLSRILVLEDDTELAEFIANELKDSYEVLLAKNGVEGLRMATLDMPQLIISDITMPEMDGLEFCKKIKEDELTSHIPVILLTARYAQDVKLEGLKSGADDYIVKPFNLEILKSRVSNLLNSRKELAKKFRESQSFEFDANSIEDSDGKLIQSIIDIILQNIEQEKINADFIAERVNMSRSLVYLKVEALTGQSVNEFVRNIRLKKSMQLLKESSKNITEIAYAVGFSSQSYFSRSFVKQFGISPKEYKNKQG
ncbi:two-component regulator propeller domain-containing protein [Belliella kenyensis]|uniref:histidine kinase n=1 Tax=Belliella kenyensis TaxID=1472724 RepID=A0ABV8ER36_9BACT|nr:two-component regulator propeller domain-containing protein [Belliella kenyensis]MCH7403366.1 ATP-binding protein [Belliella kenyensis]MDN3601578.1 two-component regulator propeller domain-containing protein [Belliella kenyensis]